jgi:hypothetical protein
VRGEEATRGRVFEMEWFRVFDPGPTLDFVDGNEG